MTKERRIADKIVLVRCPNESAGIDIKNVRPRVDKIILRSPLTFALTYTATVLETLASCDRFPEEKMPT